MWLVWSAPLEDRTKGQGWSEDLERGMRDPWCRGEVLL